MSDNLTLFNDNPLEIPDSFASLDDISSWLRNFVVKYNKLNHELHHTRNLLTSLHKLYAPWPWNVSVPPFPETWKDRNILRDPSAFTLEKLQQEVSTNLTVGNEWRVSNSKTRNRTTALHGDDHVETSNRFAALQALEDQEILDLPNPSLEYKKGDVILAMGNGASVVHCIGEDVTMGKGIAAQIEKKFSCKEKIKNQRKSVGEIAVVEVNTNQYILNLITKPRSNEPPRNHDGLVKCLRQLRKFCEENGVKHLIMPKIASGLDQIPWIVVEILIKRAFRGSNIKIEIFTLPSKTPTTSPQNTQRPQREDTMLHRVNHAVSRQPHGDVNSGTQPSGSKPTSPTRFITPPQPSRTTTGADDGHKALDPGRKRRKTSTSGRISTNKAVTVTASGEYAPRKGPITSPKGSPSGSICWSKPEDGVLTTHEVPQTTTGMHKEDTGPTGPQRLGDGDTRAEVLIHHQSLPSPREPINGQMPLLLPEISTSGNEVRRDNNLTDSIIEVQLDSEGNEDLTTSELSEEEKQLFDRINNFLKLNNIIPISDNDSESLGEEAINDSVIPLPSEVPLPDGDDSFASYYSFNSLNNSLTETSNF